MKLAKTSLDAIRRHAERTYPNECCGVIVAGPDGGERVIELRNVQDEMHARDPERYPRTARTAYTPDAAEFKRAHDLWETPGNRLLAFYHSHPDHDAYFSDEDVAQATPLGEPSYPQAVQIVVSVREGRAGDMKAYRWDEMSASFVETPLP